MSIFHASMHIISRKAGDSSTAGSAYRSASMICDERTGETHDYRRKRGVLYSELLVPTNAPEWARDRKTLWNKVESKNRRADSQVARDLECSLPYELSPEARQRLARRFGLELVERYGTAADVNIHDERKRLNEDGEMVGNKNHHVHYFMPTNRLDENGLGNKIRELDMIAQKKSGQATEVEWIRARWCDLVNEELGGAGLSVRVDHRTLVAQGLDREPTTHIGAVAAAMERRGIDTDRGETNREIMDAAADLARAKASLAKVVTALAEAELAGGRVALVNTLAAIQAKAQGDLEAEIEAEIKEIEAGIDTGCRDMAVDLLLDRAAEIHYLREMERIEREIAEYEEARVRNEEQERLAQEDCERAAEEAHRQEESRKKTEEERKREEAAIAEKFRRVERLATTLRNWEDHPMKNFEPSSIEAHARNRVIGDLYGKELHEAQDAHTQAGTRLDQLREDLDKHEVAGWGKIKHETMRTFRNAVYNRQMDSYEALKDEAIPKAEKAFRHTSEAYGRVSAARKEEVRKRIPGVAAEVSRIRDEIHAQDERKAALVREVAQLRDELQSHFDAHHGTDSGTKLKPS